MTPTFFCISDTSNSLSVLSKNFRKIYRLEKFRANVLKLASLNITSLPKHIDELRVLLADNPLDVLSSNETRLDDSVNNNEVHIPGYDIIRRDREYNGRFIYVRSTINYSLRPDLSVAHLENVCVEIRKPRSKPFSLLHGTGLRIYQPKSFRILKPWLVS